MYDGFTELDVVRLKRLQQEFPAHSDEYANISLTIAYIEDPEYHLPDTE